MPEATSTCNTCRTEFTYTPHDRSGKYCSRECYEEALSDRETNKTEYKCGVCGDTVLRWPSQVEGDVFCSRDCANEAQRDPEPEKPHDCPTCGESFGTERAVKIHHTQKHGESIAGVTYECEFCGSEFTRPPSYDKYDQNSARFCSRECSYDYGRSGVGIERVRRILGDELWRRIASRVREQADGCEMCGADGPLQTHHVVPLACGGTHADWNLIAVCPPCHGRAEQSARRILGVDLICPTLRTEMDPLGRVPSNPPRLSR